MSVVPSEHSQGLVPRAPLGTSRLAVETFSITSPRDRTNSKQTAVCCCNVATAKYLSLCVARNGIGLEKHGPALVPGRAQCRRVQDGTASLTSVSVRGAATPHRPRARALTWLTPRRGRTA